MASPSTAMIWPVGYSSPAAEALSVQSIPPTTVASASGIATGRAASTSLQEPCNQLHQSATGIGNDARGASTSAPAPAASMPAPHPAHFTT